MSVRLAHAYKDNLWNRQRVSQGITFRMLSEITGVNHITLAGYFSGCRMPDDDFIRALCNLFDVDYNEGSLAFQHMHRDWKAEHKGSKMVCVDPDYASAPSKPAVREGKVNKNPGVTADDLLDPVLELLYSKIDYIDFVRVVEAVVKHQDIVASVYGKVEYKSYQEIVKVVAEVSANLATGDIPATF